MLYVNAVNSYSYSLLVFLTLIIWHLLTISFLCYLTASVWCLLLSCFCIKIFQNSYGFKLNFVCLPDPLMLNQRILVRPKVCTLRLPSYYNTWITDSKSSCHKIWLLVTVSVSPAGCAWFKSFHPFKDCFYPSSSSNLLQQWHVLLLHCDITHDVVSIWPHPHLHWLPSPVSPIPWGYLTSLFSH